MDIMLNKFYNILSISVNLRNYLAPTFSIKLQNVILYRLIDNVLIGIAAGGVCVFVCFCVCVCIVYDGIQLVLPLFFTYVCI